MSTGAHAARPAELDLRQRVPAHSLIEQLLRESDAGRIWLEDDEAHLAEKVLSWYWGVLGERRVAAHLARLGPEWCVLHSIPIGTKGKDIDHLVIGPPGVFAINTKDHRGKRIWAAGCIYVDRCRAR